MEGRTISVVFLVVFVGAACGKPLPSPDIPAQLDEYLRWMDLVSDLQDKPVTSQAFTNLELHGQTAHDNLMTAITASQLSTDIDRSELSERVLSVLEQETIRAKIVGERLVGLVLADNPLASQGARMAVSLRVFRQIRDRLQARVESIETDALDEDDVEAILEDVAAAEIAFDSLVSCFQTAVKIARIFRPEQVPATNLDISDDESEETEEDTEMSGIQTRQKRSAENTVRSIRLPGDHSADNDWPEFLLNPPTSTNSVDLGGGFSTSGDGISWSNDRTSVTATPHFGKTSPHYQSVTGKFHHRLDNGAVFGQATLNNQGDLVGGGLGIRIEF